MAKTRSIFEWWRQIHITMAVWRVEEESINQRCPPISEVDGDIDVVKRHICIHGFMDSRKHSCRYLIKTWCNDIVQSSPYRWWGECICWERGSVLRYCPEVLYCTEGLNTDDVAVVVNASIALRRFARECICQEDPGRSICTEWLNTDDVAVVIGVSLQSP